MQKSDYLKYAAALAIFCLAASGFLSVVFHFTQPKILCQLSLEENRSLKDVFPRADSFDPVKKDDVISYYKAVDKNKNILGYAFKASKKGYSSDIVTLVGMDQGGVITDIKILSQNETPGLGSRIMEVRQKDTLWGILLKKAKLGLEPKPWFQAQFSGKRADQLNMSIDTITGATITSRAVIDSIQEKAKEIMERIKHGG